MVTGCPSSISFWSALADNLAAKITKTDSVIIEADQISDQWCLLSLIVVNTSYSGTDNDQLQPI